MATSFCDLVNEIPAPALDYHLNKIAATVKAEAITINTEAAVVKFF
jgi:hypothetical protein